MMTEPRFTGFSAGGMFILRELEPGEELPAYAPDMTNVARIFQARREAFLDFALKPGWRERAKLLEAAITAARERQASGETIWS